MATTSIGRVVAPIIAIGKAATAATESFITIDAQVPDITGLKAPDVSSDADIRFEDVAFSYPSRPNVQILDGLNVNFEAGKVTAIVGPSGSGKSTVCLSHAFSIFDSISTSRPSTFVLHRSHRAEIANV